MSTKEQWLEWSNRSYPDDQDEGNHAWMHTAKLRCPKCNAWPFDLWKAYGLIYYKCAKCGYEQRL